MILNVIDRRTNCYRWEKVDVIIEATWHDNAVPDSDKAELSYEQPDFEEWPGISVAEAIARAAALPSSLTLFLYDLGADLSRSNDAQTN
jgi:hypothetical protein